MKRITALLCVAILGLAVSLTACTKSNNSLINDYQKTWEKISVALEKDDEAKVVKLAQEATDIAKQLQKRDLTEAEKEKLIEVEGNVSYSVMAKAAEYVRKTTESKEKPDMDSSSDSTTPSSYRARSLRFAFVACLA